MDPQTNNLITLMVNMPEEKNKRQRWYVQDTRQVDPPYSLIHNQNFAPMVHSCLLLQIPPIIHGSPPIFSVLKTTQLTPLSCSCFSKCLADQVVGFILLIPYALHFTNTTQHSKYSQTCLLQHKTRRVESQWQYK